MPWPNLNSMTVSVGMNVLGANDLSLPGQKGLTQLTTLQFANLSDPTASMGLTALSSLKQFKNLRLQNVALVLEAGVEVRMGDALQGLTNVRESYVWSEEDLEDGSRLPNESITGLKHRTRLHCVFLPNSIIVPEQAAVLAALPQLSALVLAESRSVSRFRAHSQIMALTSLLLMEHGFYSMLHGNLDDLPAAMEACALAFPALR